MVSTKLLGGVIAAVIVIVVVALAFTSLHKSSNPQYLITSSANSTAAYSAGPYLTSGQAEGFIGPVQTSGIKALNTSAAIANFSKSLVANASAVWVAIYADARNASISEEVVEAINSSKAQAMYSLMTASAQQHPNYNFGTYDNMAYVEVPYNQTTHTAGFMGWKGRYDVLAFISNVSAVNVTNLVHVAAGDLK
ncbi:MAG: hypothetical protein M1286_02100 [Candidatus Marsarchaeota archaeon]|nr:hypothetical protein [Candidatus Marsarchaeota archaeon]